MTTKHQTILKEIFEKMAGYEIWKNWYNLNDDVILRGFFLSHEVIKAWFGEKHEYKSIGNGDLSCRSCYQISPEVGVYPDECWLYHAHQLVELPTIEAQLDYYGDHRR